MSSVHTGSLDGIRTCVIAIYMNLYEGADDVTSWYNIQYRSLQIINQCHEPENHLVGKTRQFSSGGWATTGENDATSYLAQRHVVLTQTDPYKGRYQRILVHVYESSDGNIGGVGEDVCSDNVPVTPEEIAVCPENLSRGKIGASGQTGSKLVARRLCPSSYCLNIIDCCPGYGCVSKKLREESILWGTSTTTNQAMFGACVPVSSMTRKSIEVKAKIEEHVGKDRTARIQSHSKTTSPESESRGPTSKSFSALQDDPTIQLIIRRDDEADCRPDYGNPDLKECLLAWETMPTDNRYHSFGSVLVVQGSGLLPRFFGAETGQKKSEWVIEDYY
ncbi:MAG: hypothetical protein M1827_002609 [Pycnora praestabilis]|nr:MAG: hypothetical protein M1827_002609 [Pycnora praestabilis]